MDIAILQDEIDQLSILLYQNQEQEAFGRMNEVLQKLRKVTDAILSTEEDGGMQITAYIMAMYRTWQEAYHHKDMLGMADCLQEYATLAAELYRIRQENL